jgi:hypothetical protein
MFNLEPAITDWRKKMLAAGIKTPVPLEELESHLRDEIERQTESGLSEAEAFKAAIQNIGQAQVIQNEFEKVEQSEEERKRKQGQILSGVILGSLQLIPIGFILFNSDMTLGQRVSGLTAIAASILLVAVGRLSYRVFPAIPDRRIRIAMIAISGGVPWLVWMWISGRFFLMGHEFPFGQWLTTLLWTCCPPLGFFLGLILGIETAAPKKSEQYV